MAHAVMVEVDIALGRYDDALSALREHIVPRVKGAPGFVRGTWFGTEQSGHSLLVMESEEQAKQIAAMTTSGPDDPVQIKSVTVYRVHAEA